MHVRNLRCRMASFQPGHGPYGCRRKTVLTVHRRWQSSVINPRLTLPRNRRSHLTFDEEKMKNQTILIASSILMLGCASSPKVISKDKLDRIDRKTIPLTGYHRDYLGSDDQYHYIQVGCVTGDKIYRIDKEELHISIERKYREYK